MALLGVTGDTSAATGRSGSRIRATATCRTSDPTQLCDLVCRFDPQANRLSVVADSFDKPNGLAFSPDEKTLYVADNGAPHHLLAFDVLHRGRHLGRRRTLAVGTPEHPDGLKVDAQGRIYASARHGLQIFDPSGILLGDITLPGAVNFTFGRGPRPELRRDFRGVTP